MRQTKKADSSGTESIETPQSKTDTSVGVITDSDSLQGAKMPFIIENRLSPDGT